MRILICDDSGLARKQAARSLPAGLAQQLLFAENGADALALLAAHPIDLMLLDLTMPVLDGFATLAALRERDIECGVVVVSGDIQPQAREKVLALGALDFIQKPIDPDRLRQTLTNYGFIDADYSSEHASAPSITVTPMESLSELANIAMGDAAEKLAVLLKTFITLPVQNVAWLTPAELQMALGVFETGEHTVVSQGFVARGVSGEALLYTGPDGSAGLRQMMAALKGLPDSKSAPLLDAASVLMGAFLSRFGHELDLSFSKSPPRLVAGESLLRAARKPQREATLIIEIPYAFNNLDFVADLMILLPGVCGERVLARAALMADEVMS